MKKVRHAIVGFFLIIVLLVIAGCAQKMVCSAPNVLIGDVCCLDADDNDICDTWEEEEDVEIIREPEEMSAEQQAMDDFAEIFVDTWNRKSYNALRSLFVDDYSMRFSAKEFNFLARKADALLGIESIELSGLEGDTADYTVHLADQSVVVSAYLDREDDTYKHEPFYFFKELSADYACGNESECFMDFAVISGDKNYCDKAGDFKAECVEKFGVSKSITAKIDDCLDVMEYYSRAECLFQVAVKENNIEPCWQAGYDKQIYECMGEVAAARKNVDECDRFVASRGYPGTRLQKAYCIVGYVRVTTNTSACAKIDRRDDVILGSMQEACYRMEFP